MPDVPGNSSTTSVVSVGSSTTGLIDFGGDHDWYRVSLQGGTVYTITLNGSGGTPLEDPYLRIRDASGNVIFENDDTSASRDSKITFEAPSSGTFFVDVAAWDDESGTYQYTGEYQLTVGLYVAPSVGTVDQFADQLVNGYWGGDSRHFDVTQGGTITVNISGLTAAGQTLARAALAQWTDIIGVKFSEVLTGGQIVFDDDEEDAFSDSNSSNGITSSATVNVSVQWLTDYGSGLNSYSYMTYLHEIGHALGLGHAGDYNGEAEFPYDALYSNDSWPMSIMSYFSRTDNGFYGSSGPTSFSLTPMIADIAAMQQLYGLSTTTRTGNTTYGFNSNAGNPVYNASQYPDATVCVYDSGGIDTLDYSQFAGNQTINLNPEQFSSVLGRSSNLVIGRTVVIENAVGGSGNDTIVGNAANNVLNGGAGTDIVSYAAATAGVRVDMRLSVQQDTVGAGKDTLIGFENLIGSRFNDVLIGAPGNTIEAGNGNDVLMISTGAGWYFLNGGSGHDTLDVSNFDRGVTVELHTSGANLGGGTNVSLQSIEGVIGTNFADNLKLYLGGQSLAGGGGADLLTGSQFGAGNLAGGTGNDTYTIYFANEVVVEKAGEGTDIVQAYSSFTLSQHVENLTLLTPPYDPYGGATPGSGPPPANFDGTGNALNNVIAGNTSANKLYGLGGNDTLTGGAGVDTLFGGDGADIFRDTRAGLNGDTIGDFKADDKIIFADSTLGSFTFSLVGNTLSYSGGSITLTNRPDGHFVASAAADGGVQLTFVAHDEYGAPAGDFNGDGRDDVLWRHDNNTVVDWLGHSSGSFIANDGVTFPTMTAQWRMMGTGDFNGDLRSDVVWRHDNGTVTTWLGQPNGSFAANPSVMASVPTAWAIVGTGDFNGDNVDDILWRHETGTLTSWLGTTAAGFVANSNLMANVPTDWSIVGAGDFNGDGIDDILWRHESGTLTDWLGTANGGFTPNSSVMANVPIDWKVVGTGDFNGDGIDDILWRHETGPLTDWLGTAQGGFVASKIWADVPIDWNVVSVGDFNGDNRDDVLWRHDTGAVTDWFGLPSGDFAPNNNFMAQVSTDWRVQPLSADWF